MWGGGYWFHRFWNVRYWTRVLVSGDPPDVVVVKVVPIASLSVRVEPR